jgi:murein DD-endopeptidase MepM/ murein hydrolase activator NlpD
MWKHCKIVMPPLPPLAGGEGRGEGGCRRISGLLILSLALIISACNFSGRPEGAPEAETPQTLEAPAPAAGGQGPGVYNAFPGDTVYGVAQRFGVPVRSLIESNGLQPPFRLAPGQRLQVPVRQEHVVQSGDTLLAIARIYGVDQSSLVRANNLAAPYGLKQGQRLVLPGRVEANLAAAPEQPAITPAASAGGSLSIEELPPPASAAAPAQSQSAAVPEKPATQPQSAQGKPKGPAQDAEDSEVAAIPKDLPAESRRFLWPVEGKVISRFGAKKGGLHNDGINIEAASGATVVAAADGVVAYAGNELRGFGNLLLIRHADGWITAYAHNEKLLVKTCDEVSRGQPIARVGRTGNVTSPQLHFEIRKGTDPIDPLPHLGAQRAGLSPAAAPAARPGPG